MEGTVSKPPSTMIGGESSERDFNLQAVSFGNNSSHFFSVEVSRLVEGGKRQVVHTAGDVCVMMFTGADSEIVLVTEPLR